MRSKPSTPITEVKHVPGLLAKLTARLSRLSDIAKSMKIKRGKIYLDWLKDHAQFLSREVGFNPRALRTYSRREIVFLNFGFNVGSEIGGNHFAVVVSDSSASNPLVNVVPLGSLESDQLEAILHSKEVYLGVIDGLNGKRSFAIPNQLRPISKIRIISPTSKRDTVVKLDSDLMDKIDQTIVSLYVKGYEKRNPPVAVPSAVISATESEILIGVAQTATAEEK